MTPMVARTIAACVFAACLTATGAAAQEAEPEVITPTWSAMPRPVFPSKGRGLAEGVEARVLVACVVARRGRLTHCQVLKETPPDMDFGRTALRSLGPARMTAPDGGALPVGQRVRFWMAFRLA